MTMNEVQEEDRDFLTTLSTLAGIAVENSRLYELATVDMMTGLKVKIITFRQNLKKKWIVAERKNPILLFYSQTWITLRSSMIPMDIRQEIRF